MKQIIKEHCFKELNEILKENNAKNVFVVCKNTNRDFGYLTNIDKEINLTVFSDFQPNPDYQCVKKGIELFKKSSCSFIIAIGGGSAIDVAKCIKYYAFSDTEKHLIQQTPKTNDIKLLAIPTTAGTGSEATSFAVIYYNEEKISVENKSLIPNYVILDCTTLETLSLFQKKVTCLDTFCHAIESFWSVNSTDESRDYSKTSLNLFVENYKQYVDEKKSSYNNMMIASNYAGKAINIAKTTAAHAMSYKVTKIKGYPHGMAVAICIPFVFEYISTHLDDCSDIRGKKFVSNIFNEISAILNVKTVDESVGFIKDILNEFDLLKDVFSTTDEINIFASSVNEQRLKNCPVRIDEKAIYEIYNKVFNM